MTMTQDAFLDTDALKILATVYTDAPIRSYEEHRKGLVIRLARMFYNYNRMFTRELIIKYYGYVGLDAMSEMDVWGIAEFILSTKLGEALLFDIQSRWDARPGICLKWDDLFTVWPDNVTLDNWLETLGAENKITIPVINIEMP